MISDLRYKSIFNIKNYNFYAKSIKLKNYIIIHKIFNFHIVFDSDWKSRIFNISLLSLPSTKRIDEADPFEIRTPFKILAIDFGYLIQSSRRPYLSIPIWQIMAFHPPQSF